jgi:hypothetical protein
MTFRFQHCKLLFPVFPESRYWDVRLLGVHSSSPLVLLFRTALHTSEAGRQTSPIPHSPNGSWPLTHYVK